MGAPSLSLPSPHHYYTQRTLPTLPHVLCNVLQSILTPFLSSSFLQIPGGKKPAPKPAAAAVEAEAAPAKGGKGKKK